MARLDEREFEGKPVLKEGESYMDYYERENKVLEYLMEHTMNLPKGDIKGGVIRFSVADGYAYYLVTKLRPLTIMHLPFGDAYSIPYAHVRGLNKADIVNQMEIEKSFHKIFSKK